MVQGCKLRIVALAEVGHAFVGGQRGDGRIGATEVDGHAPEQRLVRSDMCVAQRSPGFAGGLVQLRTGDRFRIAGDIIEAPVAGGRGQQQHDLVGIAQLDAVAVAAHATATREYAQAQGKTQLAVDAECGLVATVQEQAPIAIRTHGRVRLVAIQPDAQ